MRKKTKSVKNTIKKNDGKNDGENDEKNHKRKKYHRFKYSKSAKKVTLSKCNKKCNQ